MADCEGVTAQNITVVHDGTTYVLTGSRPYQNDTLAIWGAASSPCTVCSNYSERYRRTPFAAIQMRRICAVCGEAVCFPCGRPVEDQRLRCVCGLCSLCWTDYKPLDGSAAARV